MAGTTTEGRGQIKVGHYVVAMVDILNQRQALAQWPRLAKEGETSPEFKAALRNTLGQTLALAENFRNFIRSFESPIDPHLLEQLPPEQVKHFQQLVAVEMRSWTFSDTAVVYTPIREVDGVFPLKEVHGVLAAVGITLVSGLATGIVLRAGVTMGMCAELPDGQVYGPALAEAHRLESEVAEYPRAVIGKQLAGFLRHVRDAPNDAPLASIGRAMAQDCLRRTCVDDDGLLIVDGIRFVNETSAKLSDGPVMLIKARQFVERERERFMKEGNHKLALRYSRLKNYFDARFKVAQHPIR